MLSAGRLRHRLTLEVPVELREDDGSVRRDWRELATVWGEIIPLSGRELLQAQQVNAKLSHRITIRHRRDVRPAHRIRARGRTFELASVQTIDERDFVTECYAIEVLSDAADQI